jgi:hypothetical protein
MYIGYVQQNCFSTLGLAVGEIPTLTTQGILRRSQLLHRLLSDYEIFHLRLFATFAAFSPCLRRCRKRSRIRVQPILTLPINQLKGPMRKLTTAWKYFYKCFFKEAIHELIPASTKDNGKDEATKASNELSKVYHF